MASGQTDRLMDRPAGSLLTPSPPPNTPSHLCSGGHVSLPQGSAGLCCPLWARVQGRPSASGKLALINPRGSSYRFPCPPGTTWAVPPGLVPVCEPFSCLCVSSPRPCEGLPEAGMKPHQSRPSLRRGPLVPECPHVFCHQTREGLSSLGFPSAAITFLRAGMEVLGGG